MPLPPPVTTATVPVISIGSVLPVMGDGSGTLAPGRTRSASAWLLDRHDGAMRIIGGTRFVGRHIAQAAATPYVI